MKFNDAQLLRQRTGLTTEELHRQGDLRRWRLRRRIVRLTRDKRDELGLQPGVGADALDVERARYYRMLDRVIAREVHDAELKPMAAIGFDGKPAKLAVEDMQVDDAMQPVIRNTAQTPLDYLFFQSKARIEYWEWLAGQRFAFDWHVAQGSGALVASFERLMMAKTPKLTRAERRQQRLRPATFPPKKAKRVKQGPSSDGVSNKIDAIARIGRLAASVSEVSYWLLWQIIGRERWIKDVAHELGEDPHYIARRFREALTEAAAHYRLGSRRSRR